MGIESANEAQERIRIVFVEGVNSKPLADYSDDEEKEGDSWVQSGGGTFPASFCLDGISRPRRPLGKEEGRRTKTPFRQRAQGKSGRGVWFNRAQIL